MYAKATLAALASLIALAAVSAPALADHRKKHRRMAYDTYYAGPEVVKGIPGIRVLFGDYGLSEEEYDALYGAGADGQPDFDESYYEPKAKTAPSSKTKPAKPLTKTVTKVAPKPAPTKEETATVKTETPPVKTASAAPDEEVEVEAKPAKPAAAPAPAPATGSVSCDKASGIVSDYGFTAVKPSSCTGSIYAFNATRGGKSFAIKLDPKSGELTEVKKLE